MEKEALRPFESLHPIVLNAVLSKQLRLKLPGWGIERFEAQYIKIWFNEIRYCRMSLNSKQFLIS